MKYDSKKFYKQIGAKGMESLTSQEKTAAYLDFLKPFLSKDKKILDVGCGYGRLAVPLAKEGYHVEGVDLSPNLIEKAKQYAQKEKVTVKFTLGDMRSLPYKDESFDLVICMWSTFCYMLTLEDHTKAIEQMCRVLKSKGHIIIDLPATKKNKITDGVFIKENILKTKILGVEHVVFLHTKETLIDFLNHIKNITSYEVKQEAIGDSERLVVYIQK